MTVFAVIAPEFNEQLDKAVKSVFADHYYQITPGQYLVSAERASTSQIVDRLGVVGGELGRVLIMRMGTFNGWHAKDMWDWIAAQLPSLPTLPSDNPPDPNE
jgi:hypothetical protein